MNHRIRSLAGIGAFLILAAVWPGASAQSAVPGASGALHHPGGDESFTGANAAASFGCGSLAVSGGPVPTLTSASTDCAGFAQAILLYSFSVVGPDSAAPIPVSIASTATLETSGEYQAGYSLAVGLEGLHGGNCLIGFSVSACGTHGYLDVRSFAANTIYGVTLMVVTGPFGGGSGYAFLDPMFTIDPQYAGAYSLRFSEGILNGVVTSPVPEPETIALMAAGLLAIAARRQRMQRR